MYVKTKIVRAVKYFGGVVQPFLSWSLLYTGANNAESETINTGGVS